LDTLIIFLCYSSKLEQVIKNRLFTVYCSSFYGCALLDLDTANNSFVLRVVIEGARRVWALPNDTRSDILYCRAQVISFFIRIVSG
jgi:hypothetical protein